MCISCRPPSLPFSPTSRSPPSLYICLCVNSSLFLGLSLSLLISLLFSSIHNSPKSPRPSHEMPPSLLVPFSGNLPPQVAVFGSIPQQTHGTNRWWRVSWRWRPRVSASARLSPCHLPPPPRPFLLSDDELDDDSARARRGPSSPTLMAGAPTLVGRQLDEPGAYLGDSSPRALISSSQAGAPALLLFHLMTQIWGR